MSEPTPERDDHAGRIRTGGRARHRLAGSEGAYEISLETPDADAMEQHTSARESGQESSRIGHFEVSFEMNEVDPADAADQDRIVELDEDDYR